MKSIEEVSVFCGGRGSSSIIQSLLQYDFLRINLILNTYDDGLSTGVIREMIPGIVGPSDIRKNVITYLRSEKQNKLADFLDFRMPEGSTLHDLIDMVSLLDTVSVTHERMHSVIRDFCFGKADIFSNMHKPIVRSIREFIRYFDDRKDVDISDFALGNVIFAGMYLEVKDNDEAVKRFTKMFVNDDRYRIYDVNGQGSLFLCALKENGDLLADEYSITSEQSESRIESIYFLKQPLTDDEINKINGMKEKNDKNRILASMNMCPVLSEGARYALERSSVIIYGPGTQHASLYPSYVTKHVSETIANNRNAIKIFIMNVARDNDIASYSAKDVIDGFVRHIGESDSLNSYIHYVLYSAGKDEQALIANKEEVHQYDYPICWISGDYIDHTNGRVHDGDAVVQQILHLMNDYKSTNADAQYSMIVKDYIKYECNEATF